MCFWIYENLKTNNNKNDKYGWKTVKNYNKKMIKWKIIKNWNVQPAGIVPKTKQHYIMTIIF